MPSRGKSPRMLPALSAEDARLWARAGVLAALALVLSYIETFIPLPVPVPGVKLGLGNIAVLVALLTLDARGAAAVAALKVLAAGFLFGNPVMMAYSAAGTALAFLLMMGLLRLPGVSAVPVAVAGAIAHNVGQLAVAAAVLGTWLVWASLPLLVVAACFTGAMSGIAARYTVACLADLAPSGGRGAADGRPSRRKRAVRPDAAGFAGEPARPASACPPGPAPAPGAAPVPGAAAWEPDAPAAPSRRGGAFLQRMDPRVKFACLALYVLAALHARSAAPIALCTAVAVLAAALAGVRPREVLRALIPLAPVLLFTAAMQVLYYQQGAVLFQLGPLPVTAEALGAAGRMTAALACIMVASIAFMRCTPIEGLVGALRWALSPLRALGLRTDAFIFSLSVAFRFIPVLLEDFRQLKRAQEARVGGFGGGVRQRVATYARLFAPLVRSAYRRADTLAEASVSRCLGCGVPPTSLRDCR